MKKQISIYVLLFVAMSLGTVWAQTDSGQPDTGQQPAAPAPALGQDSTPAQSIANPPLSSLDQPALEPGVAARSFLIPGIHLMDTADTDLSGDLVGKDPVRSVTRALGSLALQKLWKNYDLDIDYAGGVALYENFTRTASQIHSLDVDQRMRWRTGQLSLRDSFTDMPEGIFGYSAFGGAEGYNLGGFGNVGGIQDAGGGSFFSAGQYGSLGQDPRITNTALAEVTQLLTPRSSVTVTGSYGLTDFVDSVNHCSPTEPLCCPPVGTCMAPSSTFCPPSADCCPPLPAAAGIAPSGCLLNSHQFAFQAGYNYQLNRRDQVAIIYGYQYFTYPVTNLGSFTTNHFHVLYGHRITGRMDLQIGGGPQITEISPVAGNTTTSAPVHQLTGTGRASLRYRFPKSTIALSYDRVSTNGSGFFGGANTDVARFSVLHPVNRLWTINGDVGYTHNSRLLPAVVPGEPSSFQNVYAGFGIRRQFGRYLGGYLTYDYSDLRFNIPVCNVTECGQASQRNTVIIGLDWHPRPIRID
ncbi:MAG TPA: hypothetical protein VH079_11370 [Terriglobales bacterium]|nr:hypothetical protein [Terriglobales bacterium]